MPLTRREAIVAIGTLGQAASAIAAPGAPWPTKAVKTVLPSGPGGGSDVVLRLINSKLQPLWQQPVIVDYRPGANSILATDAVAKAAPDGYTLGMALTAYTINPSLYPDLPYNPRDLIGLSQVASADFGLFANPSLEPSTVPELIEYAKKNPGKLSYATSGVGSGSHLAWEMFNMMAGTRMVHVPYSKGGGAAQMDVIAGRITLLMDVAFGSMNMVQQGKLKLIAFASPTRSASHPEVPLISETLPGFSILSNMGMIAPAAMPRELVDRISADIVRAVHSPDIKGRFADLGSIRSDRALTNTTACSMPRWTSGPRSSRRPASSSPPERRGHSNHPAGDSFVEQSIPFFEKKAAASNPDGSGYGRGRPSFDEELVRVGPGTPCGEFMRRYWQPVAVSSKVTTRPQALRVLGEDLVLFRDGQGRPGLLAARCAHRGTSLYYGKVDDAGIRCCYHGWQFDVQGHCLDQPCEPEGGRHKDRVRQPWYPVEERYGLVFAYMGPPRKRPVLPRWDVLEHLGADEKVFASGPSGFGAGGDDSVSILPCSWLQQYENTLDPFHLTVLHTNHSGVQFCADLGTMPAVKFEHTETGVRYIATVPRLSDGKAVDRVSPAVLPNIRSAPSVHLDIGPSNSMVWSVPVDDAHHMIFQALRVPMAFDGVAGNFRATRPARFTDDDIDRTPTRPKLWSELTEEQRQRFPGDWEAQMSQGPITHHSEENLATSDIGIVMLRRLLRQQIRVVQEGGDPLGVSFDETQGVQAVGGGNVLRD